jgi:hypothetical protein
VDAEDMYADEKRKMFSMCNIESLARYSGDKDVSKHIDTDMLVKLFFGVVLERMLLPTSSIFVTAPTLEAVHDLEKLRDIDRSYVVYEYLKKACSEFVNKQNSMNGCVAVLMVSTRSCFK